ncbi:MAG TPA: tetratricopeptide repeat protein, partial [Gemmataceae bacterium]|nr:tetratricopeptide repeat protein [Gemmataceae bacterium]
MGRSLTLVAVDDHLEHFTEDANNPFEAAGFRFRAERVEDRLFHHETRIGKKDTTPVDFAAEVQYALGSGTRARSYLINRENRLFESALTWYSQRGVWDLSPGFLANPHSDRPITGACLFCHANQVEPALDTVNRFRSPIFRGEPIGCERCHGPGQLHVALRDTNQKVDGVDESIVNPRHLELSLREAVCEQCHLQGAVRVLPRGREVFDYRPGLPLDLFWSIYVSPLDDNESSAAVSQVEQMYASRCYLGSEGKLGCVTCHDPHETPLPERKTEFYRQRCLACHESKGCSLAMEARIRKLDDCASCHMPRSPVSDVAHTAITNHLIPRRATSDTPSTAKENRSRGSPLELHLFREGVRKVNDRDAQRDLAIAQMRLAETGHLDRDQRSQLSQATLPILEAAVERWSDDIAAWEAMGNALSALNRKEDALAAFNSVLTRFPERESALMEAALLAGQVGRRDLAVDLWRRGLEVNPFSSRAHFELAKLLLLRDDISAAILEAQETIRLHPFHF